MNTFTHILKSINWVDVAMLILLIRIVFIGVKTGFVTELFKLFGILCAVFIGLHYYSGLSAFIAKKTGWSLNWLEITFFVLLVVVLVIIIKYLRDGFLILFKFETTHAGFNQWGAGILSVVRAVFLASLIMYGMLLSNLEFLQRQTFSSTSQKLALKVAPNTYFFIYRNFIGKVFTEERLNEDVFKVISPNSDDRKRSK